MSLTGEIDRSFLAHLNKGVLEVLTCISDEFLSSINSGCCLLCGSIQFKLLLTFDEPRVSFSLQIDFQNRLRVYTEVGGGNP